MTEPSFRRVTGGRVSDAIVEQIKDAIGDQRLTPGSRLPPERELTEMLGVSRVAVREALRILESAGLISIKVGAGGGAVVTSPGTSEISAGIANLLLVRSITPEDVTEARQQFEIGIIGLACTRATESDISALDEICDRAETQALTGDPYDVALSSEFHTRLAEATHNEAIVVLIASLHRPLEESLRTALRLDPSMGPDGVAEHRLLMRAIESQDVEEAQSIMSRHLARTAERLALGR